MASELVKGQPLCFQRGTEARCRRATLLSDGIEEARMGGNVLQYAHIAYEDPEGASKSPAAFETTRHHDPAGGPNTWHLVSECPHPSECPYK